MSIIINPQTGTRYHIEKCLGSGAFGQVYKAFNSSLGMIVAIKTIQCCSMNAAQEAAKEAMLHATINHPNIVRCYTIFTIPNYMGSITACLVEEFCDGGSLADQIRAGQYDKYRDTKSWMLQMLSGLIRIHSHNIIHRDIKAQNVFIKGNVAKIGDLGIAVARFKIDWNGQQLHQTMNGDRVCIAPEMFARKPYDVHIDVFGAGVILLGLITGTTRPMYKNEPIGYAIQRGVRLDKILNSMHINSRHVFRPSLEGMLAHSRYHRLSSSDAYRMVLKA